MALRCKRKRVQPLLESCDAVDLKEELLWLCELSATASIRLQHGDLLVRRQEPKQVLEVFGLANNPAPSTHPSAALSKLTKFTACSLGWYQLHWKLLTDPAAVNDRNTRVESVRQPTALYGPNGTQATKSARRLRAQGGGSDERERNEAAETEENEADLA